MPLEMSLFVSGFVCYCIFSGWNMYRVGIPFKREVSVCGWLCVISLADFSGKKMVIVIPGLLES